MRKDLKEMNVDSVIIPGECTKYIQATDACWKKPLKVRMTELYNQWLSQGVHQFTEGGNMKPTCRKRIIEWVLDAWYHLSMENIIKLLKCYGLNHANDSMEDDFIHCLKKRGRLRSWKEKAKLSDINFS